jgi:cysteinyl-tRNA synthetase
MGHARTYVSLDIVRRILTKYLGYNVIVCQNVTDIDDKIIIRSAERQIPFLELASKYEVEFFEDMAALGVQLPNIVTRVSEYVPEIVEYIQKLIEKGIAYESNGSVYFDTSAFEKCGHCYGKLMPEQIGNSDLLAEGEGALTANDDKRNATDFALWKKRKEHKEGTISEPSWSSPWGEGRPGWHIECSVMSSTAVERMGGGNLDVHAGGVDLKFPHHENEIAQSEGHSGSHQWVNYWLHTGHLHIKGFKMSKSLKNFITIRQGLEVHTARQIRFCFLLHKYNAPMDYSDSTMTQAVNIERAFNEYFLNIKALLRRIGPHASGTQHVGPREFALLAALESAKERVREAILDDFDTPRAVQHLLELIRESNRYVEDQGGSMSSVTIISVAKYITSMLDIFGLMPDAPGTDIGFPLGAVGGADGVAAGAEGFNKETLLAPYLDALTQFREAVRVAAMSGDTRAVLQAADVLRDVTLPDLGVRMEDKGSGADVVTVWKLDDPEKMRMERAQKEAAKAEKLRAKEEAAQRQREKEEKARVAPEDLFRHLTDQYSNFDSVTGIPTHTAAGEELSKGALKKLQKEWEKQKELHEKYKSAASATK